MRRVGCTDDMPSAVRAMSSLTPSSYYSARRFDADQRASPLRYLDSGGQISAPNYTYMPDHAVCADFADSLLTASSRFEKSVQLP